MPTDLNTAMDLLRVVQLKTKPAEGLHPIHQAEQLKEYARDLADCHPDDVVEACKLWPRHNREWPELAALLDMVEGQKRLRLARERRPGTGRRSFDIGDPWSAPFGMLGIGLQVARGQYLLACKGDAGTARSGFNHIVATLGFAEARRLADMRYRPVGDHEAVRTALEEAASLPGAAA
jgi:hypothetical protein